MIPEFDIYGVLPPVRPGEEEHSSDRAPYPTDILTFCQRFGTTDERCVILGGLLALRKQLAEAGLGRGFQWLDGSFTEDVEAKRSHPPNDVDVVTFVPLSDQRALYHANPELFDEDCKSTFYVDHYWVATDQAFDMNQARYIAYWYSMWAHRRGDFRWKGFVAVSLTSNDAEALAWVKTASIGGLP